MSIALSGWMLVMHYTRSEWWETALLAVSDTVW